MQDTNIERTKKTAHIWNDCLQTGADGKDDFMFKYNLDPTTAFFFTFSHISNQEPISLRH